MFTSLMLVIVVCLFLAVAQAGHVFMEKNMFDRRPDFVQVDRANPEQQHEVLFAVKQKNLAALHDVLMEVSHPDHPKYGKHLTREEVGAITSNPEAVKAIESYLSANGVTITKKTPYGEYISASATIATWEKLLATSFFNFKHASDSSVKTIPRAHHYSIDSSLEQYIQAVFYTVHLPTAVVDKVPAKEITARTGANGYIIPSVINSFYNVTFNDGGNKGSQSLFEAIGQYYSPNDLAQFETTYGIPSQTIAYDIGGYVSDSECTANLNNCAEANLDVQYMIATAQNIPTTYWYVAGQDIFLEWVQQLSAATNPPLVHSISYGATESSVPTTIADAFEAETLKLGVQGISIFVSSGDDGAAGNGARYIASRCGYEPSYPATCPYVTAVGATQGPESDKTEVVCDSKTGGVITSGGGFSTKYAAPSWQTAAISSYLSTVSPKPVAGYNTTGRGFPDLSLAGYNYEVVIGGKTVALSGTSASSPTLAAFFSLINSKRIAAGKSALGFLNPSIYTRHASFANDITTGSNLCTAGIVCCAEGFYAAPGWDPATGWGSVNFGKLYDTFFNL